MARSKPTHVTRGNVLDDLGFSPEQATALKFKADLYQTILKHARKYSPKQLQLIMAEPQPRVSELCSTEKLPTRVWISSSTMPEGWGLKRRRGSRRPTNRSFAENWRQPRDSINLEF